MTIHDKDGNVIATSNPPESRIFDEMVIHNACLAGLELEGISFDGSDLRGSDFTDADLYGAFLADANFEKCILVGVDLRHSCIHNVNFRNTDLRNARLSLDELGGELSIYRSDFTGANLDGADFTGVEYDSLTIFPEGFDSAARGALLIGSPAPPIHRG
jgi:uncharacterized protein YjbI with pentapeptide repeats